MAKIVEGDKAPNFSFPSSEGKEINLSDFKGKKNVVLYFYPKDNTPGCTQEACDFRDGISQFARLDAVVLGVSADSLKAHDNFRKKFDLPFPLLSDESKKVIQSYDVWKEKSMYGKKYMGIERSTFVIDKKGVIRKIFLKVKVRGHVQEICEALKLMQPY